MIKRVFIIHGWDGAPDNSWIPWLKKELEGRGFVVETPAMPNPEVPEIDQWVDYLSKIVGEVDKNTYFVGHSIGCQTILRYLDNISNKQIGGVVCIAGWFKLPNLETDEEKEIAKPWLEKPINFAKIREKTDKIVAIFSDNDQDVDLSDKELFEINLGAKTLVEHNMGHFSDDAGIKELPSALGAVLEMSK